MKWDFLACWLLHGTDEDEASYSCAYRKKRVTAVRMCKNTINSTGQDFCTYQDIGLGGSETEI